MYGNETISNGIAYFTYIMGCMCKYMCNVREMRLNGSIAWMDGKWNYDGNTQKVEKSPFQSCQ